MRQKNKQTKKDLALDILYIFIGFFWIYGVWTNKFVQDGTNIFLVLIGGALILQGIFGIRKYYLQNKP